MEGNGDPPICTLCPSLRLHSLQMQKVIIPREIQEISRVLFGNLPTASLAKSGLKPYNRRPLATPMELTNPRSIHEILKAPLQFPTDDLILNGYTPYQWMRYSEKISDPFAKKQAGQLVDEEEQFYYRPPVREWPGDERVQNGPSRLLGEEGSEKAIPGQGTSKEGRGKEKRVVLFIYGVCLLFVYVVEMGDT